MNEITDALLAAIGFISGFLLRRTIDGYFARRQARIDNLVHWHPKKNGYPHPCGDRGENCSECYPQHVTYPACMKWMAAHPEESVAPLSARELRMKANQ